MWFRGFCSAAGRLSGGGVVVVSLSEGEFVMLQETLIRVQGRMSGKPHHTQPVVRKENYTLRFSLTSVILSNAGRRTDTSFVSDEHVQTSILQSCKKKNILCISGHKSGGFGLLVG